MPKFSGIKLCQDANTCALYRDLHKIDVQDSKASEILTETAGLLGNGGNSGFQSINLAVQFGATRIALAGFDMHTALGLHWHGHHGSALNNPKDLTFVKWRAGLNGAAATLRDLGVDVVNLSKDSAVTAYPKMTITQAMARWRL